jgi:hypothetical protein
VAAGNGTEYVFVKEGVEVLCIVVTLIVAAERFIVGPLVIRIGLLTNG